MDSKDIQKKLESLSRLDRVSLLIRFGHCLSIFARDAYEFQAPGVKNPRLLRDINEIQHQVFNSLLELNKQSDKLFCFSGLGNEICGLERGEIAQQVSIDAFEMALKREPAIEFKL